MNTQTKTKISRLLFITGGLAFWAGGAVLTKLGLKKGAVGGASVSSTGPSPESGHRIRFKTPYFKKKEPALQVPVAIAGGGIAGLSAAYKLTKSGLGDSFAMFECQPALGGNSRSANAKDYGYSDIRFPLGAHYLPFPNPEAKSVLELLRDLDIITGTGGAGLDVVKPEFILSEPKYRLFQFRKWLPGEYPRIGFDASGSDELERFSRVMGAFKKAKGSDGKRAFTIPVAYSSSDPKFTRYDKMTMADFLSENDFNAPSLYWYVDYACRDDFGASVDEVSAWAGIHYFCSRRGIHSEAEEDGEYLVWPEGNGYLVDGMRAACRQDRFFQDHLVREIESKEGGVRLTVESLAANTVRVVEADYLVYGLPLFLTKHLFKNDPPPWQAPPSSVWVVANVVLKNLPDDFVRRLRWDNLILHSDSLGYVVANHNDRRAVPGEFVFSYYLPLLPAKERRLELLTKPAAHWAEVVTADLKSVHPKIGDYIDHIDIAKRGHAMAIPEPGWMWDGRRAVNTRAYGNIVPAHSDIAGYSVFEEANYYGVRAAEIVMQKMGVKFQSSV